MSESAPYTSAAAQPTQGAGGVDAGLLVLRVVIGLLFAGHGAQKLFGAFGGPGLAGWERQLAALGYEPARWFALAQGIAEFAGGLLLAVGLFTPLGAAALLGVMINAIPQKLANGLWIQNQGYEYEIALAAVAVVLAIAGPGRLAPDRFLRLARGGTISAAVGILLGAGAGVAALVLSG